MKLVQCQSRLNLKIIEGAHFTHTWPITKGFGLSAFLKVIHTPKTPVKRVFSSNPKINFPHSDFHNIEIRTFHKPIIHPYDNDQLSKGKKIQKKKFQKKKKNQNFFYFYFFFFSILFFARINILILRRVAHSQDLKFQIN